MKSKGRVWIVDDDADVRSALSMLLRSAGYSTMECAGGAELLDTIEQGEAGCILLDLRMPRMSGLAVQRELEQRGLRQPVVFLSGHGDIPVAVRAVQAGALDFLEKPVRDQNLVAAVDRALKVDRQRRATERGSRKLAELVASMSPREAEVAELVAQGMKTAEIAEKLDLSPRTIDMHRARLLRRVGAKNAAEVASLLLKARGAGGAK